MKLSQKKIYEIAMQQSAYDCCCQMEDFTRDYNVVVYSQKNENARSYIELPLPCHLVSYGSNIVASCRGDLEGLVRKYIDKYDVEHCFETPNMHVLNDALQKQRLRICFMAEYFLPDVEALCEYSCGYELRLLGQKDFADLYTDSWSNALCEKRKELDVLGVGAYDGETLVGLAACSADCVNRSQSDNLSNDTMWQIGVDVLLPYRRQGIAAALTSRLALEIMERGRVPFYCAAWSNIKSVRNAIKSGFRPAWVEMTAKPVEFVEEMNEKYCL